MIRAVALTALGVLELVTIQKPKQAATAVQEFVHQTKPFPAIAEAIKPKKAPRRKHACPYSREDIWGSFLVGLLLGGFLVFVIF